MIKRVFFTLLAIVVIIVFIAISISYIGDITSKDIYFPTQKAGNLIHHDLKGYGWLIFEKGALRVRPFYYFGESYLMVWPSGYSVEAKGREIRVIDRDGQVVARTGHWITYGGGPAASGEVSQYYLEKPIPEEYPGPFYIVSGVD